MGGKRRSSKHQGIRKKRKNANKQTLARVAERKEEHEAKLERKLADAEARILATRLEVLGGIPQAQKPELVAEQECIIRYGDHKEDDERSKIVNSKIENQQSAYQKLSNSLESSIFDEDANEKQTQRPQKNDKPVAKRPRVSSRKPHAALNGHGSQTPMTTNIEAKVPQDIIEKENYAAAIREKAHFDSYVKPLSLEGKLVGICAALPGVGKVSGLISDEGRSKLETNLKTDLANFGASRIGMPPSLYSKWIKAVEDIRATDRQGEGVLKPLHRAFIAVLREYHDLFLSHRLSISDEDMMRRLYVAHCLSHVLRCRGRVIRNDATKKANEQVTEDTKDQGFSRARVLLLLPYKNVAYEVVKMLQHLAVGTEKGEKNICHVANSERFETEFAPESEEGGLKDSKTANGKSFHIEHLIRSSNKQSDEHQHVFRGNIDDDFKLGVAISKKAMKLYTDFYESDIIIASPLGLRRTIAEKAAGQARHSQKRKEQEHEDTEWKTGLGADAEKPKFDDADEDFLSSIEICVVDGANIFSMQNWDTLLETIAMVNKMPVGTRDTDFSRVRDWCLDGLMPKFRQTVVISSYRKSEFMTLFRELSNHEGRIQVAETPSRYGSMSHATVRVRQTFFKVPGVTSPAGAPEKRLNFFFDEIFPQIRALLDSQCLLMVPNYFDFVRVRNKLVKAHEDDPSFCFASMCEYSKGSDISRARSRLFDGSVSLVVMTERFHFFWRHWIRGANTVVWYGLPENCHYYPEILNMTVEAVEVGMPVQSMALYDSFDAFPLERIVGRTRRKRMIADGSRSTFLFA